MEDDEFEKRVLSIARDKGIVNLNAELLQWSNTVVSTCRDEMEATKRDVFLSDDIPVEVLRILPSIQQETFVGRARFISRALKDLLQLCRAQQRSSTQPSTMSPASPPSSITPNTSNAEVASEALAQGRSRSQRTRTSNTSTGRRTRRIQKARQEPSEIIRRSACLKKLRQREKLG